MSTPANNSNPTPQGAQPPVVPQPPNRGLLAIIWDLLQDAYDTIWVYCDPVTKVCYTHISRHYEHKYRKKFPSHHSKVFYFDMFLLALLSFLLVAWFFVDAFLPLVNVPQLVRIDATSPGTVVSGRNEVLTYTFANNSDRVIGCAIVRLVLPPASFVDADFPQATAADRTCTVEPGLGRFVWEDESQRVLTYTISSLAPHATGDISYGVRVYGASGSTVPVSAEIAYWEESATTASRVASRTQLTIASSTLVLYAQLPPRVERDRTQALEFNYTNAANRELENVRVRVAVPEDFVVTGASPSFGATREWLLGDLAANDFGTLTLRGYFKASPVLAPSAPTFTLRAYVADGASPNVLAEALRINADTRAADLTFYQEISVPSGGLVPGETVQVTVHYRNEGGRTLQDAIIVVDAGAPFIAGGAAREVWFDKTGHSALASIPPQIGGTLTATFTVEPDITPEMLGALPYPALHISSRGEYAYAEDPTSVVRVDTNVVDLPIASRLGIEAAALYYTRDGDQLGVGPLPPQVGQPTKYRVFLSLTATTGDLGDVVAEATLPPNVRWTGESSVTNGSSIDYLPTTRKLRWQAGLVPKRTGGDAAARIGASIEVEIVPTEADLGASPELLRDIAVTGKDVATGLTVHATAAHVTTDLPFDVRAAGKGAVVEAEVNP